MESSNLADVPAASVRPGAAELGEEGRGGGNNAAGTGVEEVMAHSQGTSFCCSSLQSDRRAARGERSACP